MNDFDGKGFDKQARMEEMENSLMMLLNLSLLCPLIVIMN